MDTNESNGRIQIEPRWPAVLAVLGLLGVLAVLPARVRLLPPWAASAVGAGLILPMLAVWMSAGHRVWLRVEHVSVLVCCVLAELITLTTLSYLIVQMMARPEDFSGLQLFTSSVAGWISNILVFALIYWRIDRGGPEPRANGADVKPDWLFPQASAPEATDPAWRPTFVDYLFVAFTAAAAFSPADAMPLTPRAKLLTMAESSVSLTTLVVVASRAIGLLGG
jgi:hypothetical protein